MLKLLFKAPSDNTPHSKLGLVSVKLTLPNKPAIGLYHEFDSETLKTTSMEQIIGTLLVDFGEQLKKLPLDNQGE